MLRFSRPPMHFQVYYRNVFTPTTVPPNLSSVAMRAPERAKTEGIRNIVLPLSKGGNM